MTGGGTYGQVRFLQIPPAYSRVLSFVVNPGKLFLWIGTTPFLTMEMGDLGSHSTPSAVKRETEAYKNF